MGQEIVDLVVRFARENVTWGYDKIQGALANLGHTISDQTVGNILKDHGIEPVPERKRQTTWATFLKAHWDVLGSIDFTTIEVWTKGGLVWEAWSTFITTQTPSLRWKVTRTTVAGAPRPLRLFAFLVALQSQPTAQ